MPKISVQKNNTLGVSKSSGRIKRAFEYYYFKYCFLNPVNRAEAMRKKRYFKSQGASCYIGGDVKITNPKFVSIGNNVWIATNTTILTKDCHGNFTGKNPDDVETKIGNRCFIGSGAILLKGIAIGDDTIIGAGTVVAKSFPEGKCVIAGNPAAVIKKISGLQNGVENWKNRRK